MGGSQNVIIPVSFFFFSNISSRQTKASKGKISPTFSETFCKEKILNIKQNTMVWQVTPSPG